MNCLEYMEKIGVDLTDEEMEKIMTKFSSDDPNKYVTNISDLIPTKLCFIPRNIQILQNLDQNIAARAGQNSNRVGVGISSALGKITGRF